MRLAGSRRGVPVCVRARLNGGSKVIRSIAHARLRRSFIPGYGYGTLNVRMRSMITNSAGLHMRARKGGGEREVFSLPFPSPFAFRARMCARAILLVHETMCGACFGTADEPRRRCI